MLPDRNSDLGPSLRATTSVLVPIVTMFIAMRIWIRYIKHQLACEDVHNDDIQIVFSIMCAAGVTATTYGFGKRSELVTLSELPMMRLYSGIVASVPWSLSITSAKASFAILYLRILQPTGGTWVRPLNISVLVFLACQATEEILVVLLQCQPFAKAYDDTIEGTCYSLEAMWLCDFAFNFAIDLILFIQPIPTIWSLQIASTASKIGITTMLVCLISIARLFAVLRIREDTTYETALAVILCQVEIACTIICSCVPALNQFVRSIGCLSRIVNSTEDSYSLPQFYARSGQWRRRRSSTVNDVVYRDGAGSGGLEGVDEQHHRRRQRRRQEDDGQNQDQGGRRERKPWSLRYCWKVLSNASRTITSSARTGGGGTTSVTLTPESAVDELGLEMNPLGEVQVAAEELTRRFVTQDGVEMWHQPRSIEHRSSHSTTSSQEVANQFGPGGLGGGADEEDPAPTLDTIRGLTVNIPTWLDRVSGQDVGFRLQSTYGDDSGAGDAGDKSGLDATDSANEREDVDDEKYNEADDDWVSAREHGSPAGTQGRQTPRPELSAGFSEIDITSHEKGD
ncbi:hypothetical protein PspLS_11388 [Pyricularia sp. CBS 133598]|nr:hypothetical protein PspLS_11388 [Pyricularia sp. CBS 133598]